MFKNQVRKLHTTRSWDFMGGALNKASEAHSKSIWAKAHYGEDVIIANLDTGRFFFLFIFQVEIRFLKKCCGFERSVARVKELQ